MTKIQVNSQGKAYLTSGGKALVASGGGDTINIKNGRLVGNVSYNPTTGDATNFSNTAYIEDYFKGFDNKNFEAVFKFTTGSDVSNLQIIAEFMTLSGTNDYFQGLEFKIENGNFYGPFCISGNWTNDSIFSVTANTTYYVKIVFSVNDGSNFKYYMKQNAQDEYVFKAQSGYYGFTMGYQPIRSLIIGNSMGLTNRGLAFSGTVHLNESYIKSSHAFLWKGSDLSIQANSKIKYAKRCNLLLCERYDDICIDSNYSAFNFNTSDPSYICAFIFPSSGSDFTFYGSFFYDGNTSTQDIYDWDISNGWVNIALRNGYLSICGSSSNTALVAGKTYDFKCEWDGNTNWTQYIKESTSDTWIEDDVITDFSGGYAMWNNPVVLGLHKYNATEPFTSYLNLDKFKLTQGNNVVWQAVDDDFSIVSSAYPYGQYYSGIATGNVSSGLYEVTTILGA